jgi:hypothetical protein
MGKRYVETADYAAFMSRIIRRYGERVGDGDEIDLARMLKIRDELDAAIQTGVDGLRRQGHSWDYIAAGAGISRQSAWERWKAFYQDPEPDDPKPTKRRDRSR